MSSRNSVLLALTTSVFLAAGCGSPPPPIQHRVQMETIAATPPDQRNAAAEAYEQWQLAQAELAHVEFLIQDIEYEIKIAKAEQEQARSNERIAGLQEKRNKAAFQFDLAKAAAKIVNSSKSNTQKEKRHISYLKAQRSFLKKRRAYAAVAVDHAEARFELEKANIVKNLQLSPKGFKHESFVKQEQKNKERASKRKSGMQSAEQKAKTLEKDWRGSTKSQTSL